MSEVCLHGADQRLLRYDCVTISNKTDDEIFLALMKKVSKSPTVLNIQGVQRSLKRARTLPDSRSTGITAIFLNEESTVITGVATKEGEEVMFFASVSTAEFIHMANAKFQYDFEQDKS